MNLIELKAKAYDIKKEIDTLNDELLDIQILIENYSEDIEQTEPSGLS